jgi:hypothetical protein
MDMDIKFHRIKQIHYAGDKIWICESDTGPLVRIINQFPIGCNGYIACYHGETCSYIIGICKINRRIGCPIYKSVTGGNLSCVDLDNSACR